MAILQKPLASQLLLVAEEPRDQLRPVCPIWRSGPEVEEVEEVDQESHAGNVEETLDQVVHEGKLGLAEGTNQAEVHTAALDSLAAGNLEAHHRDRNAG